MTISNILGRSYILGIGLVIGTFSGCEQKRITRREISDILHEDAMVTETIYMPRRHGSATGVDFNLNVTFSDVDIPEKYALVFKCQHGKFVIEGKGDRYKQLWSRFTQGDLADVEYKESYISVYEDKDGDGKKDLVERRLVDYDFIDAQPKKSELKAEKQ